jgi:predicted metalloprotease with PDZ domain
MRTRNWWATTSALVLFGFVLLSNAGFGAEKKSDEPGQAANRDRSDADEDAQYHATLGVSINESDGRVSVIAVAPGSPAARAGLRVGDEIRYVDDQRIRTTHGLIEAIREYHPGSHIDLSILRNGERQVLKVKLGSESQQLSSQQFRALQKQIARLQQEIEDLRSSQYSSRRRPAFDASQWQRLQRMGEADDDPALFQ